MEQPKASTSIFETSYKAVMWRQTLRLTFYLYVVLLCVMYLTEGVITFVTLSRATAAAAALLIGFSFALSGFCYYWDFLDSKIGLRKYLGLMGFWLALAYSLLMLVIDPDRYFFGFLKNFWTADFVLGLVAIAFLALGRSRNRGRRRPGREPCSPATPPPPDRGRSGPFPPG